MSIDNGFLLIYNNKKAGELMKTENVRFYDDDFKLKSGTIEFDDKITEIVLSDYADENAPLLIPGFVDIHAHGAVGQDWCEDCDFDALSRYYASNGVTSVCPTTMTLPVDNLADIAARIEAYKGNEKGAYIHGINLEGPFVSKEKCGAQNPDYLSLPNVADFERIDNISKISLVDVAPELDGALDFAEKISHKTVVSIAHTNADYKTAKDALSSGFTHATHLHNAMTVMSHRSPGVVGAVFEDDNCTAELICDGFHIDPAVVKVTFKILGKNRVCVISDSLSCTGLDDCEFPFGGQTAYLKNGEARLKDGTIAGSTTNIYAEFKNLLSFGIDFETALRSCTINPARAIGVDNICGSIKKGKNADMILLDNEMNIVDVYIKGEKYER